MFSCLLLGFGSMPGLTQIGLLFSVLLVVGEAGLLLNSTDPSILGAVFLTSWESLLVFQRLVSPLWVEV